MLKIKRSDFVEALFLLTVLFTFFLYFGYLVEFLKEKKIETPFKPLAASTFYEKLSPIYSESLVVIEKNTGQVLFSKNPDILFPPASLTKMVTLFMIYEKIHHNGLSKDTIIPISPTAWWKMLPRDATKMFLEPGQIVSLYDLMLGLTIPSGNDAAIAVAEYLGGNVKNFVKEMNETVRKLGFRHTYFEDPNGYSPNNYITAREFALFCREYLLRFPESIKEIHNVPAIFFPAKKNYPKDYAGKYHTLIQSNHNPFLGRLEGANGLKTGFLGKSGFNVAVSVKRDNTELIAVDLGSFAGFGNIANENRVKDVSKVINYLYKTLHFYPIPQTYKNDEGMVVYPKIEGNLLYHSSPIISSELSHYALPHSIMKGQIVNVLSLKDEKGEKATYPLFAREDVPARNLSDLLWGWIFKIRKDFTLPSMKTDEPVSKES